MRLQQSRHSRPQRFVIAAGVLQISGALLRRQFQRRFENGFVARIAHLAGGSGLFFFGGIARLPGLAALPGGTKVAHVFPDSGWYSTVLPGIGGMRIK